MDFFSHRSFCGPALTLLLMKSVHTRPSFLRPGLAVSVPPAPRRSALRAVRACYCPERLPRGLSAQTPEFLSAAPADSELTLRLLAYPPLETRQLQDGVSEDVLDAMRRTLSGMMGLLPSTAWVVRTPCLLPPPHTGKRRLKHLIYALARETKQPPAGSWLGNHCWSTLLVPE